MIGIKTLCATLLFVFYVCRSVADRPNYLTDEDFARARLLQSTAVNGTITLPPNYRKDHRVRTIL